MNLPDFNPDLNKALSLPTREGLPTAVHCFDKMSVLAVKAALATRRPLLVRGDPGTGKSQLARAVAVQLGWPLVYEVVSQRTECHDLLYHFDAVARLAQAQVLGCRKSDDPTDWHKAMAEANFLRPGVLWWAFDWVSAAQQADRIGLAQPPTPTTWSVEKKHAGVVVLIDEIDKAESDVPNGLLEALGNGCFQVPIPLPVEGDATVTARSQTVSLVGHTPPLVVITTNEERQLPPAFLRRCLVLKLDLPKDKKDLIDHFVHLGKVHSSTDRIDDTVLRKAAEKLVEARLQPGEVGFRPGLAEYLDLVRALAELAPHDPTGQLNLLNDPVNLLPLVTSKDRRE